MLDCSWTREDAFKLFIIRDAIKDAFSASNLQFFQVKISFA